MQRMSRWQRLLLVYLLVKLHRSQGVAKKVEAMERRMKYVGASGGVSDHDLLTNVTANQHHTAYTDAEAIAAVEGEATLDLTGDVSLAANKTLTVDAVGGIKTPNMVLYELSSTVLALLNAAKTVRRGLFLSTIQCDNVQPAGSQLSFRDNIQKIIWESHTGVVYVTVMEATAGTLRMANLPGADPADGTSTLWSNGGVVTVGT